MKVIPSALVLKATNPAEKNAPTAHIIQNALKTVLQTMYFVKNLLSV